MTYKVVTVAGRRAWKEAAERILQTSLMVPLLGAVSSRLTYKAHTRLQLRKKHAQFLVCGQLRQTAQHCGPWTFSKLLILLSANNIDFALKLNGWNDKEDRRALCAGKEPVGWVWSPHQCWRFLRLAKDWGCKVYIYSTWKGNILIPSLYLKPFLSKVDVS